MIVHTATLLFLSITSTNADIDEVASWRFPTFDPPPGFPGASPCGDPVYAPGATFTGIQANENKIFLSIPRFLPGLLITLGWVPRPPPGSRLPVDTPINAFPNWDWHRAAAEGASKSSTNCSSSLISVSHSKLDRCGRLWVVDSGAFNSSTSFSVACLPKLLAFNTTTGEVLHRMEFSSDVLIRSSSYLQNLALDDRSPPGSSCSGFGDLFIYITSTVPPGIVVYDVVNNAAWKHTSRYMHPDPDWDVFKIAGESIVRKVGILQISLSNPFYQRNCSNTFYNERTVYFQALSSNRIYSVLTIALRAPPKDNEFLPVKLVGRTSSQSMSLAVDPKDDSFVFSPCTETVIASYQPAQKTVTEIAYSPDLLQAVTDVFVEPEQIWAISTRLQKFFRGTETAEEVNLRVLRIQSAPQNH